MNARPALSVARRYWAWEKRHAIAFGVVAAGASLLFIVAVNMWHFAPRWVVGIVAAYGISACMSAVYRITLANRDSRAAWAGAIIATVLALAGLWVLVFRTMPAVVRHVVQWVEPWLPVIAPVVFIVGGVVAFVGEARAKGATWAGFVDTLRGVRAARRADREARRDR